MTETYYNDANKFRFRYTVSTFIEKITRICFIFKVFKKPDKLKNIRLLTFRIMETFITNGSVLEELKEKWIHLVRLYTADFGLMFY